MVTVNLQNKSCDPLNRDSRTRVQGEGAVPLPGVDHRRRLMVSAAPRSGVAAWEVDKLLVKQEWDAIAETAKAILDGRISE